MELTFWQLFSLKMGLGFVIAFSLGWWTSNKSRAYKLGLLGSFLAVLLPGCVTMYQANPVEANRAAVQKRTSSGPVILILFKAPFQT
jgi:hypothetical protein